MGNEVEAVIRRNANRNVVAITVPDLSTVYATQGNLSSTNQAVGTKATVYRQASTTPPSPPEGGFTIGDLWFKTDLKNEVYTWTGASWQSARDLSIADAQSTADTAQSTAQTAQTTANSANTAAAAAQTTADDKNSVFYQASEPVANKVNDLWFDTDDGNKPYKWTGTAWVAATFGDSAIAGLNVGKLVAGQIAAGQAIYAGPPTGQHAEMNSTGFAAYQVDKDGNVYPATQFGTGNDAVAIADATGNTLASIDPEGGASFQTQDVAGVDSDGDGVPDTGLTVYGRDFSDWYWNIPWGVVAGAYSADLFSGNIYTEYGLGEITFIQQPGREYKVTFNGLLCYPAAATTRIAVRMRYTNNGTAPQVGTSAVACTDFKTFTTTYPQLVGAFSAKGNWGPDGATIRVMISIEGLNALNVGYDCRYQGGFNHPFRLWAEDIGPEVSDTFQSQSGGGVLGPPGGTATPPTSTVKKTYTKTYRSLSSATYQGGGGKRSDTTDVVQGYNSYNGDGKGLWIFPSMTADLAGATVTKVQVYAYANHWYFNSGGTAFIKVHGYSAAPASSPSMTTATTSSGWPKPGGRWVTLPSSLYAGFQNGTYKGFGVGPAGSTNLLYYGRFNGGTGAYIKVTYVK